MGAWFQGEIVGQFVLNHSNLNVHMVQLTIAPLPSLTVHGFFFDFDFDQPRSIGVTDRDFAREFDLIFEYAPVEHMTISAGYAYATPGRGGRQAFGPDDCHLVLVTLGLDH